MEDCRICISCNAAKPTSAFYPNRGSFRAECKDCHCSRQRAVLHLCPDCGETVRARGRCGFCVEQADGVELTETIGEPAPVTAEANRKRVAVGYGG